MSDPAHELEANPEPQKRVTLDGRQRGSVQGIPRAVVPPVYYREANLSVVISADRADADGG